MNRLVRSLLGRPSAILWFNKLQLYYLGLQLSMLVRVLEGGGIHFELELTETAEQKTEQTMKVVFVYKMKAEAISIHGIC